MIRRSICIKLKRFSFELIRVSVPIFGEKSFNKKTKPILTSKRQTDELIIQVNKKKFSQIIFVIHTSIVYLFINRKIKKNIESQNFKI